MQIVRYGRRGRGKDAGVIEGAERLRNLLAIVKEHHRGGALIAGLKSMRAG